MAPRRMMRSVLYGFLGTFVSRYSDFHGYWLLGQLEPLLDGWEVDLLDPTSRRAASSADAHARQWASQKLWQQVSRHGLSRGAVCAASVRVSSVGAMREEWTGEHTRRGRDFVFQATATVDTGKEFSAQRTVFVAPHSASLERRSLRR